MSGGGGSTQSSGSGSSHSEIIVPEELQPLYQQSASNMMQLQNILPLWGSTTTKAKSGASPITTSVLGSSGSTGTSGTSSTATSNLWTDENGNLMQWTPPSGNNQDGWVIDPNTGGWMGTTANTGSDSSYNPLKVQTRTPYSGSLGSQVSTSNAGTGQDTSGLVAVKNADGTYSYYQPTDTFQKESTPNFLASNPMQVAGLDQNQIKAAQLSQGVGATPENETIAQQYGLKAPALAGRMATGAGVSTDPAVLAASKAFDELNLPTIQNEMGLAGLGKSSSLANAMALSKTSYMLPLIEDYIAREQTSLTNEANMYGSLMSQFAGLGTADTARELQAINALSTTGATNRQATQDVYTSSYQDYLRRQALAEQAMFVPFGATATASIGPTSDSNYNQSSSGSQSSGMFK